MGLGLMADELITLLTSFAIMCIAAVVSLVVCCTIAFISFPSGHIPFMAESIRKHKTPRTIEYQFDRIIDVFHFILDAVSDLEELSCCHPGFLLCQFIQSFESVLNLRISQQLL